MATGDIIAARVNADGWTLELDIAGFKIGGNLTRGRSQTGTNGSYASGAGDNVQYSLDPFGVPKLWVNVSARSGYSGGNPVSNITDVILATVSRRFPYSAGGAQWTNDETNNTTYITIRVVLAKQIFSGETLTVTGLSDIYKDNGAGGGSASSNAVSALSATNNSTATATKPCVTLLTVPKQLIGSTGLTFEWEVTHFSGRAFRMVDSLTATWTGVTSGNTVTKTISAMTLSTVLVRSGCPKICVFASSLTAGDMTGFTQGEQINSSAVVKPFVGPAFSGATDGVAYPTIDMPQQAPFYCDKSDALRAWATVDPTGVLVHNGTTGSTAGCNSTATENTSTANCYATHNDAANALFAFMGRSELAGGVIYTRAGTYATWGLTTSNAKAKGNHWLEVRPAPSTNTAGVTITTTAGQTATARVLGGNVKLKSLTLATVASASVNDNIMIYGPDTTATPSKYIWVDACEFTGSNTAATPTTVFHQVGMQYWTNSLARSLGASFKLANGRGYPLVASCLVDNCGLMQVPNIIGCKLTGGTYFQDPTPGAVAAQSVTQQKFDFSVYSGSQNNQLAHGAAARNFSRGSSCVQSMLEGFANSTQPLLQVSADRDLNPIDGFVMAYTTVIGQRLNVLYNSEGASAVSKRGVMRFCVLGGNDGSGDDTVFNKRDTYNDPLGTPSGPQAGRIGDWYFSHRVDSLNNLRGHVSFGFTYCSPTSEIGDYDPRTDILNPGVISLAGVFINNLSGQSGAGGGDYHPTGSSNPLYSMVPSGLAMLPFDLDGVARRNDGTGAAGPYERTDAAPFAVAGSATSGGTVSFGSGTIFAVTGSATSSGAVTMSPASAFLVAGSATSGGTVAMTVMRQFTVAGSATSGGSVTLSGATPVYDPFVGFRRYSAIATSITFNAEYTP